MTLGFAATFCKAALKRGLACLAGIDFAGEFLSFFVKYIVLGGDEAALEGFEKLKSLCSSMFDAGYSITIVSIINAYALTKNESSLLAAICFFGLLNTISLILELSVVMKEMDDDCDSCCSVFGFGFLFQSTIALLWLVGFCRVLFYAVYARPCSYPSLSGDAHWCTTYMSSTIEPYITTAYGEQFPYVTSSSLYDVIIKSADMDGGWVTDGPVSAQFCLLSGVAQSDTYQDYLFYIFNGGYTKMMAVNFYITTGYFYYVYAQAITAKSVSGDFTSSCESANSAWISSSATQRPVATSDTASGYGLNNIVGLFPTD
eukprot:gene35938-43588_t